MGRAVYRDPRKQRHTLAFSTEKETADRIARENAPKFYNVRVKKATKKGKKGYKVWFDGV